LTDAHENFGVDLFKLYKLAHENLPTIAKVYHESAAHVAASEDGIAVAFARPPEFGGPHGYAHTALEAARDLANDFLIRTAVYFDVAANALARAVQTYAEADDVARRTLENQKLLNGLT
jgi:hypothetical protein